MEIKGKLKFLRITPRKTRSVLDVIRGLSLNEAEAQLSLLPQKAAQPILKLLHSVIANATNNYPLKKEDLFIKRIEAGEGPTIKRWMPKAFGRATPIKKRSSHITIILGSHKEVTIKKQETKEELRVEKIEEFKNEKLKDKKEEKNKKEKEVGQGSSKKGFGKKIFSRKAI